MQKAYDALCCIYSTLLYVTSFLAEPLQNKQPSAPHLWLTAALPSTSEVLIRCYLLCQFFSNLALKCKFRSVFLVFTSSKFRFIFFNKTRQCQQPICSPVTIGVSLRMNLRIENHAWLIWSSDPYSSRLSSDFVFQTEIIIKLLFFFLRRVS